MAFAGIAPHRDTLQKTMIRALILSIALLGAHPVFAVGFVTINDRDGFFKLVEGRQLTKFFVRISFDELGQVKGHAWGRPVMGYWRWEGQQLCKRIFYGTSDQGENCVEVRSDGQEVLFIPNKGEGKIEEYSLK